jgi:hypothetical protein
MFAIGNCASSSFAKICFAQFSGIVTYFISFSKHIIFEFGLRYPILFNYASEDLSLIQTVCSRMF